MSKSKKYFITTAAILGISYLLTVKPEGSFLTPVANLVKEKITPQDTNRSHTLDLQKYRPDRTQIR